MLMIDIVRWKDEGEVLGKRVSAAEHLHNNWSKYENELEEAEASVKKLETELDDVIADTEAEHVHTCLEQLQVRSQNTHTHHQLF